MTVDLDVSGRRFRVVVTPLAPVRGGARVRVVLHALDGDPLVEERLLDVRPTASGLSLLEVPGGRVLDAALTAVARNQLLVQLAGVDLDVHVNGRRHGAGLAEPGDGGEQRVCAPMPGRVLRVLVETGSAVVAGQALVVIEAMKMENALTAVRDGVVHEIAVAEGVSVEMGRLLVRLS